MIQAFDRWNEQKKITHSSDHIPYFKRGEIWWMQIGKNIASESFGKGENFLRPVIIFQKLYGASAFIIPLTSQKREGSYYFSFLDDKNTEQTAILSQIRYADGRRLKRQLSKVPPDTFLKIQDAFIALIKNNPRQESGGS